MSEVLALSLPPGSGAPPTPKSVPSSQTLHPKLVKADFHGAVVTGMCLAGCCSLDILSLTQILSSSE